MRLDLQQPTGNWRPRIRMRIEAIEDLKLDFKPFIHSFNLSCLVNHFADHGHSFDVGHQSLGRQNQRHCQTSRTLEKHFEISGRKNLRKVIKVSMLHVVLRFYQSVKR